MVFLHNTKDRLSTWARAGKRIGKAVTDSKHTGRHSYVIDRSYHVVYMNELAKRLFPRGCIGDLCFEAFRSRDRPCIDCPWHPESDESLNQEVIYSQRLDRWFEILCLETDWPGSGSCILFSSQEIDESSKSLFFALTKEAAYDELFELNLDTNSYQVLYSEEDKFVMPAPSGALDALFQDVLDNLVCPDDRERFTEFWDLDTIVARLNRSGGSLQERFRKKLVGGGWQWATQTVVSAKRGAGNEPVLMCFIAEAETDWEGSAGSEGGELSHRQGGVDQLTGLYDSGTFMRTAAEFVAARDDRTLEFLYIDIENFKVFNEWFGRDAGDRLLETIADHLKEIVATHTGLAGYLGGDDFVILLPAGTAESIDLESRLKAISSTADRGIGFQPAIGACLMQDPSVPIRTVCDHAMTAALSIKGNYTKRMVWYEEDMTHRLEEDPKILIEVQRALENHEFVVYWQPQCHTGSGKIVGVEALVRWNHPQRGLVGPGDFIPILERNGFIASLDLYVWEEACRHIKSWVDRGRTPVPACVNISRGDLYSIDIVQSITDLVDRYGLDRSVLHLEITESAYAEDEKMIEAVSRFKELGFTVFIDDFGSGYSSLNMLREIKADVVKIDMKFLDTVGDKLNRSESILESIVSMTHLMELSVVAEGAETQEQIDFLKDIGCTYVQGFYYYRPLSTEQLEQLLMQPGIIDHRGINYQPIDIIEIHDIFKNDLASRTIIDNIVGAMAVYALSGDQFELLQVNKQYYRIMQCDPDEVARQRETILEYVHPEDRGHVLNLFKRAEKHTVSGALGTFRRYTASGAIIWIRLRVFHLRNEEDRKLFYATLLDVTHDKMQEDALRASQETLGEVMGMHGSDQAIGELTAENQQIAAQIFAQSTPNGLIGGYCEEGFPIFFANNEMIRMLGCDSYADLVQMIDGQVANAIQPDDFARISAEMGASFNEGEEYDMQYRMLRKDGIPLWITSRGRVVKTGSGRLAIASVCVDISENKRMQSELELEDLLLKSIIEQADLNVWLYDIAARTISFKNISDRSFAKLLLPSTTPIGPDKTAHVLTDDILALEMFPEESKAKLIDMFTGIARGKNAECEITIDFDKGPARWFKVSSEVVFDDQGLPIRAIGYLEDIDEVKRRELDLKLRADRDSLTGLLNRSAGSRSIKSALAKANKNGGPGAFLIFDLDDFKQVNDRYGHLTGDRALIESAERLARSFRANDIVCRWGGDEFVVYCSGVERKTAENKAIEICAERWAIDLPDGQTLKLSVTAGIALVPEGGFELTELYRRADDALYEAKDEGKGRFSIYGNGERHA